MFRTCRALSRSSIRIDNRFPAVAAVAAGMLCMLWAGQARAQSAPPPDPFLGVPVLTSGASTPGGTVTIVNNTDLTSAGDGAHALVANASAGGYPQSVIDSLTGFSAAPFSFDLTKIWNADSSLGTVGLAATGTRVDVEGNAVAGAGGSFVLNADGTFTFDPDTDFADLADGESVLTSIRYEIKATNSTPADDGSPRPTRDFVGTLVVEVARSADTGTLNYSTEGADFEDLGSFSLPASTFPDLKAYVTDMLRFRYSGGPGSDVDVTNTAALETGGVNAHGIYAVAEGQRGPNGRDASFTRSSQRGDAGGAGGNMTVRAGGTITTSGYQSAGVVASSVGGAGGTGGEAGWWWSASSGGPGGNGGQVRLFGDATINTTGEGGVGVLALSQGGRGGDGGGGATLWGADNGATGGAGGTVIVDGAWKITTSGKDAYGIYAKSLGGAAGSGGRGGWTGTDAGDGGEGTEGGSVTVTSRGAIKTSGENAHGIFVQSIGGFGGSGGSGGSLFYASGGDGAAAGSGGDVSVTNDTTGSIFTSGAGAHGIFAQSIGGGGGSGGSGWALVGFGGSSESGGNGGTVAVTNRGTITTTGSGSRGIYAQSIGGGGGDGGNAYGLAAIGGAGSTTSNGGNVTVANTGSISSGHNAILAQSIGGSGGNGGSSAGWFSFGGSGGSGGNAGTASVGSHGNLATSENNASAILAQSVGGGGGSGGNSVAVGAFVAVGIGGSGASGGTGSDVVVGIDAGTGAVDPVTGIITTKGKNAHGIQAQSVGGGGGSGGFAVSVAAGYGGAASFALGGSGGGGNSAGLASVYFGDSSSVISTSGENANGIFAQSVGGGGGSGGFSIAAAASNQFSAAVSLGGTGGSGGSAGSVFVGSSDNPSRGFIQTSGAHSYGLFAQSAGGGGGNGGFSISGTASALGLTFTMGGAGGGGGAGAGVTVDSGTSIGTLGADSHALFAQSVGGGGGAGAFSVAASASLSGAINVGLGGLGGLGGDAGRVDVRSTGAIGTSSDRSNGIFAQSVGGGGGAGGFSIAAGISKGHTANFSMGGTAGGGGEGGNVTVTSSSSVRTDGANSHGLVAQSVGGGGGTGGWSLAAGLTMASSINVGVGGSGGSGGWAGLVTVSSSGAVSTTGNGSHGIFAQSVGGGGGDGGFTIGAGISKGSSASFGIGGSGEAGGVSRAVSLTSSGAVTTGGEASHGLFAQSVGGGGGNGGFAISGTFSMDTSLSFSLGGSAGTGQNGDTVGVKNTGTIATGGRGSHGLFAQSIGGGGGNGGFAGAFTGSFANNGKALSIGIGGKGGGAGTAGAVNVSNSGTVITTADDSIGLFAQSIGGGGGNAGFGLSLALSTSQQGASAGLAVGGSGGAGGAGSTVTLTNDQFIRTAGDHSQGILAQSIGGGGGNGGFAINAAGGLGDQAKNISVAVGGGGGPGSHAGTVSLTNNAGILTSGDDSSALQAQSIGGGGGNGGFSVSGAFGGTSAKSLSAAVGGTGGTGATGGTVNILGNAAGAVITQGERSHGIFAQSIGGGGGSGGFAGSIALGVGGEKKSSTAFTLSVGGFGGRGNTGGTVNVGTGAGVLAGDVVTFGNESAGILAQSIGGGGGTAGFALSGSVNLAAGQGSNNALAFSVGGKGGIGNNGGAVNVNHSGAIGTWGDGSHGIQAQSIGGGGGNGGSARSFTLQLGTDPPEDAEPAKNKSLSVTIGGTGAGGGTGGAVSVIHAGNITTRGGDAHGLFAQSIGGGGGNGGDGHMGVPDPIGQVTGEFDQSDFKKSLALVVGGSGGASGSGGSVTLENTGAITTFGAGSYGVFAQSIGGGGGAGGNGDMGDGLQLTIGGGTGTTGDGGIVSATLGGSISTHGTGAMGIVAQSIGGGGGTAGGVDGGFIEYKGIAIGASFGQSSGTAGSGGSVTIDSSADIFTEGTGSTGIFAQSIGGGGGLVGSVGYNRPLFAGSVGGDGSGGTVNVAQAGNLTTTGDEANGIFAQSAGGKAAGGNVSVTLKGGNIFATGARSNAIFAQSIGQQANGNISVTILHPDSIVASNTGAAVRFADGENNTLTTYGTLTTVSGTSGTVVIGGAGNETVNNYGTIAGSVDLGAGVNHLNNRAGALFNAGSSIELGRGGEFANAGTLSPGGAGYTGTTALRGNFTQSATPTWLVDIGQPGVSDTLAITGNVKIHGSVTTVDINELATPAGTGTYTLASAQGGGLGGGNFRFGTLAGEMPVGRTFDLQASDTALRLTLENSSGTFHWNGSVSGSWLTPFVNGQSNWTRTTGGTDYVFGTPGSEVDVVFSGPGATVMGADLAVNSLLFAGTGGSSQTLYDNHSLTLRASGGRGVTVDAGSNATLGLDIVLGSDQAWLNDGTLTISGATVGGSGNHLTIDGGGTTTIGAAILTGTGSLTKAGNGLLALRGANQYSGGTTITAGTLLGSAASLQGDIWNDGTLVFDQAVGGIYAGSLGGGGVLRKQGAGSLLLSGDSRLFTGSATLDAGQMFVQGWLGGNLLELRPGTLLGGYGTVPTLAIQDGAVLSPGYSIGTIRVAGDVVFNPGSIYSVEVEPPSGKGGYLGSSDLTIASGTLSADGGVVRVLAGGDGYRPINQYLIFTTGNQIDGSFSGATSNVPYLDPSLAYPDKDVHLVLRRNDVDFTVAGTSGNQTAVALALNGLVKTATGSLATVVNNVYDLPDGRALEAMTSMTGLLHHYVARSAFDASRSFTNASTARLGFVASGDDRLVPNYGLTPGLPQQPAEGPSTQPRYRGWVSGFGVDTAYSASGADAGASGHMWGHIVGLDAAVRRGLTLGFSAGRTWPRINVEGTSDRAGASMAQLGAYGRYTQRYGRLDVVFGAGRFDYQTSREVTDGVTTLVAQSKYRGNNVSGRIEYGYPLPLGHGFDVEPGVGVLFGRHRLDAFSEDGADVLGLSGPARNEWSTRVLVGSRVSKSLGSMVGLRMMLEGRAAWSRELETLDDMFVRLRGDSSAGFTLSPPGCSRDSGIFGFGFGGVLPHGFRLFAEVDAETGAATRIFRGNAGLTRAW